MAFKRIKGMISESDPRVSQIGHPGPPWMISYADLMTELVCFFIILYALSASLGTQTKEVQSDVAEVQKETGMDVKSEITKEGIKITIEEQTDKALFASGQASLSVDAERVIGKLVPTLKKFKYDLEVQGHTDNVPVGRSPFASNWELSTARATSVVRYLIDQHGYDPIQLGAVGYGEFRPIDSNETPQGRAANRRVVFLLKTQILGEKAKREGQPNTSEPNPVSPAPPAALTPAPAVSLTAVSPPVPLHAQPNPAPVGLTMSQKAGPALHPTLIPQPVPQKPLEKPGKTAPPTTLTMTPPQKPLILPPGIR